MNVEGRSEIKVRLNVAEFECSPEEITKILSIKPTKTWLKGEPVSHRAKNLYKENGWRIELVDKLAGTNINTQVEAMLSAIAPRVEAFEDLPNNVYIELACIIYVRDNIMPAIGFSAGTIKMLAKLGANIDIDIYDLSE